MNSHVNPLMGEILSAHRHRPRFLERAATEPDFTGLSVRIPLQEVPLTIHGRTVSLVSGEAHVVGRGSTWQIESLWVTDHDTGARVHIGLPCEPVTTLVDHVAAVLAAEADRLAPVQLWEAR